MKDLSLAIRVLGTKSEESCEIENKSQYLAHKLSLFSVWLPYPQLASVLLWTSARAEIKQLTDRE